MFEFPRSGDLGFTVSPRRVQIFASALRYLNSSIFVFGVFELNYILVHFNFESSQSEESNHYMLMTDFRILQV